VILLSYLRSVKWANRLAVVHGTLTIAGSLALLIAWAISVGIFKIHDKDNHESDLWSWACAHSTATHPSIDWKQVCMEQVFSIDRYLTAGLVFSLCFHCDCIGGIDPPIVPLYISSSEIEKGTSKISTAYKPPSGLVATSESIP
jgi:hypothetical protein